MADLDFPHEVDLEEGGEEGSRRPFVRNPNAFSMLPVKDKEVGENRLFFLAFNPNRFPLFEKWPDMMNYYLKFFVHWVEVVDETGNARRISVLCEPKMNAYAKSLSRPGKTVEPIFASGECAFCDNSQGYWDEYRDKKKDAGIDNLSVDGWREALAKNPDVARLRDLAKEWGPSERYYFAVFDVAKATGQKPLEEIDEGQLRIQGYLGPDTILTNLYKKQKAKYKFWDFDSTDYRVVQVTRDNSRGVRFCEYFVEIENEVPNLPPEILQYLRAAEDIPDPLTLGNMEVWTTEQKQAYVEQYGNGGTSRRRGRDRDRGTTVARPAVNTVTPTVRPGPTVAAPAAAASPTPTPAVKPVVKPETVVTAAAQGETPAPPAPPAEGGRARPKVNWR